MRAATGLIHFLGGALHGNGVSSFHHLAARRFGRQTLLDWMIGRVSQMEQLHNIAVLAPPELSPSLIERIPPHILVVPAQGTDALRDLLGAVEMARTDALVLVGVERPFVDPGLIDELVLAARGAGTDYACYCHGRAPSRTDRRSGGGKPEIAPPACPDTVGIGAEWCSAAALRRLDAVNKEMSTRACCLRSIATRTKEFSVTRLPLPAPADRHDLRLILENAEDWDHALTIVEALGPEGVDWRRVTRLLDQNPEIRRQMARSNGAEDVIQPHIRVQAVAAR